MKRLDFQGISFNKTLHWFDWMSSIMTDTPVYSLLDNNTALTVEVLHVSVLAKDP